MKWTNFFKSFDKRSFFEYNRISFIFTLFTKMKKPYDSIKLLQKIRRRFVYFSFWLSFFVFFGGLWYIIQALSYFDLFAKFFETHHGNMWFILLGIFIFFVVSNLIVWIIWSILISRLEKKNLERLENFWHRIQAKVEDIEMGTYGKNQNWCRFILLKRGDEIFEEILKKDPFGYLDFWDSIEILIDPEDKENIYVNLESAFDLPINKERMQIDKWKEKERFTLQK